MNHDDAIMLHYTRLVSAESPVLRVRSVSICNVWGFGGLQRGKLFNDDSWASAKNTLKEILHGYYSASPGIHLYTRAWIQISQQRRIGMEMIDCSRRINRVETYHKRLNIAFVGWHVGVTLSVVLLAEN